MSLNQKGKRIVAVILVFSLLATFRFNLSTILISAISQIPAAPIRVGLNLIVSALIPTLSWVVLQYRHQPSDDGEQNSDQDDLQWRQESFPAWDSDEGALRVAREDARASLDQTISSIQDIDKTAMTTLRLDLLILGLILTAITSVPATLRLGNLISIIGFCLIVLSAIAALITNIGSDYPTGVSEDYLLELQRASWTEWEWNEWMIREYGSWLKDAGEMASGDARALLITQVLLGLGFLGLLVGIVLGTSGTMAPVSPFQGVGNQTVSITGGQGIIIFQVVFYVASPMGIV